MQTRSPEEEELGQKLEALQALGGQLAERELAYATRSAEAMAFGALYLQRFGTLYAVLDELEARLAARRAAGNPDNDVVQQLAAEARDRAEASGTALAHVAPSAGKRFAPGEELKRLYRQATKLVHPDLGTDPTDAERRQGLMAGVNRAYEEGDEETLRGIIARWQHAPDAVVGEDVGARLIRAIRGLSQIRARLDELGRLLAALDQSEMAKLMDAVAAAEAGGRDLLAEMVARLERRIEACRAELEGEAG